MQPLGLKPFIAPPPSRQPATVQVRPPVSGPAAAPSGPEAEEEKRNRPLRSKSGPAAQALRQRRPQDLFERAAPTVKLPVIQSFPPRRAAGQDKADFQARPQAPAQRPASKAAAKPAAAKKPEATMLIQARDVAPGPSAKPALKTPAASTQAAARAPGALETLGRSTAGLAGRAAGAGARALAGMELSAQLRRVANPSALWGGAARMFGAAGDALRGASSRWDRHAQGVQTAQRFADGGGKLSLPRGGLDAAGRANGASDWRRAGAAFATSSEMMKSLAVADDEGARGAASRLLPLLADHARSNPANADAHRAMRLVADAASSLGAAREPADAALAARELRSAGKQVMQLFAERGGGAAQVSSDQAASLQRLATVVRGGDEAADAFKRGSHRSLAAIGAELASALSQGGDGQAAQALALRDRTHELLSAQSGGGEADTINAAKRLHVAIRQAQAGAQWERERLLQNLDRSSRAA